MMRPTTIRLITLALVAFVAILPRIACAHGGGTPRLSGELAGPFAVYAWSEPEPLREGDTHLTIAVTIPGKGVSASGGLTEDEVMITDAEVRVTYTPFGGVVEPLSVDAVVVETLGTVYYEADTELPATGAWEIDIAVSSDQGAGEVSFETEVLPTQRLNRSIAAGVGVVILVGIGVISILSRIRRKSETTTAGYHRKRQAYPS